MLSYLISFERGDANGYLAPAQFQMENGREFAFKIPVERAVPCPPPIQTPKTARTE